MALSKMMKVFYVAVGVAVALQAAYADDIEWVNTRPENGSDFCGSKLCPADFQCLRPSR
jgi:hypothetical protein